MVLLFIKCGFFYFQVQQISYRTDQHTSETQRQVGRQRNVGNFESYRRQNRNQVFFTMLLHFFRNGSFNVT